jgi:hypothetical protein
MPVNFPDSVSSCRRVEECLEDHVADFGVVVDQLLERGVRHRVGLDVAFRYRGDEGRTARELGDLSGEFAGLVDVHDPRRVFGFVQDFDLSRTSPRTGRTRSRRPRATVRHRGTA